MIYMLLSNNPSSGDINLSICLVLSIFEWPFDTGFTVLVSFQVPKFVLAHTIQCV